MPARVAGRMVITNHRGVLKWEIGCKRSSHDTAPSENGNPLCLDCPVKVVAITSAKQGVWIHRLASCVLGALKFYDATPLPEKP